MEQPWLKNYPKDVPETINPSEFKSIADMFDHTVKQFADRPAVKCMGLTLSYQQLDKRATRFAAYLQSLGFEKGDRLALMLPNVSQYLVALYGAFKAGLVVVNVNPLYSGRELTHQLNDADAKGLLVLANFAHTVQAVLSEIKVKHIIVTEMGDLHPFPKSKMINFVVKRIKKIVPAYNIPKAISFVKTIHHFKKLKPVDLEPSNLAFLQYTGGTTGVAKGAMLNHYNMVANVEQAYAWLKPHMILGEERAAVVLPLYHIFSLLANALVFMRTGGLNILVTNPRDLPALVEEFRVNDFTALMGVNTLFNTLLGRKAFRELDFSKLKIAIAGGMALQKAVADKWHKITGMPIMEGFGLTETSPIVCINPIDNDAYNGSIGLPVPSTNVKVVDDEDRDLPAGEVGELCVQGPQVMQGYWRRDDETEKVMLPDGWLKTGDMARVDENGFVYIVDRKKDMIDVSGFNVYPNEVEDVIARHPDISEVAVIGIPHPTTGESVKAYVVSSNKDLGKGDLIAFCKEHLVSYKIPRKFEFVKELPKNNVGKILRRVLREELKAARKLENA